MGVIMWGLHMGLTQGLLASLVTDTSPEDLRGTAFGIFNFAGGVAMLAASLVAGALWDAYGPAMTFLCGGAFTVLGLAGLGVVHRIPGHASPDARTEA
jgi:MFS family permease